MNRSADLTANLDAFVAGAIDADAFNSRQVATWEASLSWIAEARAAGASTADIFKAMRDERRNRVAAAEEAFGCRLVRP